MENIRIPYKEDIHGNPIYVRLSWAKPSSESPRPIALIYHAGGLLMGSSEIVPQVQIDYLARHGFVVVMPNYRLLPQVSGREAFGDSAEAFDWAQKALPGIMQREHAVSIDSSRLVILGHSSGGTMAMHLASFKPVKAISVFYPFLFAADLSTSGHLPTNMPPFADMPDFTPTQEEWATIVPPDQQLAEVPFSAAMGPAAPPRSKWMAQLFKHGKWLATAQPDGDFASIDPMTRVSARWPPVLLVHGSEDSLSGRSKELVQRAGNELKAGGVSEVQVEIVDGEGHLFDHPPSVGTTDLGPKWQAVKKGLDWLVERA